MRNTIFIKFPWSKNPANEVYISADQIRTVYDIIIKAFLCKYKYEQGMLMGKRGLEKYDLDRIKVYNAFVDEVSNKVFNSVAKDYIFSTLKSIRSNNFDKKCVKESYDQLFILFNPEQMGYKVIKEGLAKNPNKFIDFYTLFERCNNYALTPNFGDLKELIEFYEECRNSQTENSRS